MGYLRYLYSELEEAFAFVVAVVVGVVVASVSSLGLSSSSVFIFCVRVAWFVIKTITDTFWPSNYSSIFFLLQTTPIASVRLERE